ncbi:hypothetical protein KXQ82_10385 [Mucilaginibacter sp. HMF5004]|uniref:DUF6443 domain-containing protein n=1 Tax=Mucilaginibacter rivuli TaxID=2857527 RepID=UPI001C5D3A59|nr:DUF6443 domain-containing protein [Mucilaginibacter rivuli]MBW4890126.1 hypothetical protein [Mucilaginibacter rivuli]
MFTIIFEARSQDINSTYPVVLPQLNGNSFRVYNGYSVNITSSQSVTLLPGVQLDFGSNVSISIANPPGTIGTPMLRSYVQTDVVKVAGITTDSQLSGLTPAQKQTSKIYIDGLGRQVQAISVNSSPLLHDIVQNTKYDDLGRQAINYLPYTANDGSGAFRLNATSEQAAFYNNGTSDKVADDQSPFAQQVFENSPLQRILQTGSVGAAYQPGQHYKSINYRSNTTGDNVICWSDAGANTGTYNANKLNVQEVTDEQGRKIIVFANLSGQTVLKRQLANEIINGTNQAYFDTYYIYNRAGSLSYVIPPKAFSAMVTANDYDLTQPGVAKLLFKYSYDNLGRVVEKVTPGNITVNIVYDPLNRPLLIQDANLRAQHKWNYIKYDAKGRAISQGIYTDATTYTTPAAMQQYVSGLDYTTLYYEERVSGASATGYYTNNLFPSNNLDELSYVYYDDYDIDNDGNPDFAYNPLGSETATLFNVRGMLTATRTKTIGQGFGTPLWLTKAIFYNDNGVAIQTQNNNQLNASINDVKTIVVDFTGKPQLTKVVKVVPSGTTTVVSTHTYDHADRLLSIDQSYNSSSSVTRIAGYTYNELGQMVDKKLHSTDAGATYLQSLDYRYNIQGRLVSINNSTLTNDGVKNDESNDVFGMEILYNQIDNSLGNTAYFNGNVSAVKWIEKDNNGIVGKERSYKYEYDNLDRLKNAIYADRVVNTTWSNLGGFDEKNIKYDQNGNILTLQRNAIVAGSITAIDDLNYTYNGNQLDNVIDGSGGNYTALGFKNVTNSTQAYTYDDNGNLTNDYKKGLTLTYNSLNRTDKITINTSTGRYITYTYDATAVLLRKQVFDSGTLQKTTDYIDGFVYENSSLVTFSIPEGRVRNSSGTLKPEYVITDNMGNARVSFEEQSGVAVVRQENSYYPFGMVMNGSNTATPSQPNKNLYNGGSEWQNDFADMPDYSQTFYRNYDAALGRWIGVDPKAELYESMTPYQYGMNNPLRYNDPLGDMTYDELVDFAGSHTNNFQLGTWTRGDGFTPSSDEHLKFDSGGLWGSGVDLGSGQDIYLGLNGKVMFTVMNNTNEINTYALRPADPDGTVRKKELIATYTIPNTERNDDNSAEPYNPYSDPYHAPGTWSEIWNSDIMRTIIPDMISVNVSVGFVFFGGGAGISHGAHLVTRGPDAGLYNSYTTSIKTGVLYVDLSGGVSLSRYNGPVADIRYADYLGDGKESGGKFLYGYSGSISHTGWTPTWITGSYSVGLAIGSFAGTSYTYPISGQKFNQ